MNAIENAVEKTLVMHAPIVETRSLLWHSEADTQAFAEQFAQQLAARPALRNAYVELHGELGAGKTSLVRHLLRALGVPGRVKSPTYTVVEPYSLPNFNIWHFDFYRFNDPREWEDAGFRDIFASPGLKLAEWPEKAAAHAPPADLAIKIEVLASEARSVQLCASTATGVALLACLR